jgi:hypothetical protein
MPAIWISLMVDPGGEVKREGEAKRLSCGENDKIWVSPIFARKYTLRTTKKERFGPAEAFEQKVTLLIIYLSQ